MGDFQGHPFRGNQWTDGTHAGASSEGTVVLAGASSFDRRMAAMRGRVGEERAGTKTKAEWEAEAEASRLKGLAAAGVDKALEQEQRAVWAQRDADLQGVRATKDVASRECGRAYGEWNRVRAGITHMPDADDEAGLRALTPEQRAAAENYRTWQERTVEAQDAWSKAQDAWAAAHPELERLQRQRGEVRGAIDEASRDREIALGAARSYERDAARQEQTGAAARDPRETGATAPVAVDAATTAYINGALVGKNIGTSPFIAFHADENHPEVIALAKEMGIPPNQVPYKDRPLLFKDKAGNVADYKPNFEATVKNGKEFKASMSEMFPGAKIEGVPRDADPHVLTMVHDEFRALRDEFPEVAIRSVKLNAGGARGTAWSGDDKITFGKEGITSFTRAQIGFGSGIQRETPDERPDFHDGARSYASVVRHEFAHQLHFQHPELLSEFNREVSKLDPKVRSRVTSYANSSQHEYFAETFAMAKYGDKGTKAHPAVVIMKRVTGEYFQRLRAGKKKP